jgi:hypothetical protein
MLMLMLRHRSHDGKHWVTDSLAQDPGPGRTGLELEKGQTMCDRLLPTRDLALDAAGRTRLHCQPGLGLRAVLD